MKQQPKSFEILSNSGLRNPKCLEHENIFYGFLSALFCCVKAYNNLFKTKTTHLLGKIY